MAKLSSEAAAEISQQNYILRRARAADSAAIRAVAEVTWEATFAQSVREDNRARVIATSYSDEALRRAFRRIGRDNWFWVAESGQSHRAIIGFAEVSRRSSPYPDAELTRIYVLPGWQRQGIGQALLTTLLTELQALQPDLRPPRLFLAVAAHNQNAITFYEQRGFQHNRNFQANLPGQTLDMQEYVIEV